MSTMKKIQTDLANPFPGLRPFRTDEHHLFFGREDQTAALLQLLRTNRFLAVVGTSGSGKSSLVRAGMIAELYGGIMSQAGSSWEILILRPGGSPIENLARAFVKADLYDIDDPESLPRLRATLTRSRYGLLEAGKQSKELQADTNLLIVVDQFEELFRFRRQSLDSEEAATAFVNLLLTASEQTERPIYVTITMRSDYLGDCSEIPGLAEAVNRGEYLIPRLSRDQKRDAIEKPIGVGGAKISPFLVQRMLNEVGDDPDQLPVLQHALMRTWNVWQTSGDTDRVIDVSDFEATGGLSAALSQHADEIYNGLSDDLQRRACEKLFKTLTEKGADNRGIRRPTRMERLQAISGCDIQTVRLVLDQFRQAGVTFLMPGSEQELTDRTVIDLSHESLMRGWSRLKGWVEEEAQSARIYCRLSDTAGLWHDGKAGLFRDPDLQIASSWRDQEKPNAAWAEQYGGSFEAAMAFLDASHKEAHAEERMREEVRQRELQQAKELAEANRKRAEIQRQSAGRLRRLAVGMAFVAVAAVVAFVMARSAQKLAHQNSLAAQSAAVRAEQEKTHAIEAEKRARKAENEAQAAADRRTASLVLSDYVRSAELLKQGKAADSLATLGRALRLDNTHWQSAMRSLSTMTQHAFLIDEVKLLEQNKAIVDWDLSADTDLIWSVDDENKGVVWDGKTGTQLYEIANGEPAVQAKFSPDGKMLSAIVGDTLRTWDARTGKDFACQIDVSQLDHGYQFADNRIDRELLIARIGDEIEVWDAKTGEPQSGRLGNDHPLVDWSITPDGQKICVLFKNQQLVIWNVSDGVKIREIELGFPGHSVHVGADSELVLVRSRDRRQVAWWSTNSENASAAPLGSLQFDHAIAQIHFIREKQRVVLVTRSMMDGSAKDVAEQTHEAFSEAIQERVVIHVHDTIDGTEISKIEPSERVTSNKLVFGLEYAPVAGAILNSRQIRIWDLEAGQMIAETTEQDQKLKNLRFSPDGQHFFAFLGAKRNTIQFWRTTNAGRTGLLEHDHQITGWRFDPAGTRFFTVVPGDTGVIRQWDHVNGKLLSEPTPLSIHRADKKLRFLSDGLHLVGRFLTRFNSGFTSNGELRIWNTDPSKAEQISIKSGDSRVRHAEFSPDGESFLILYGPQMRRSNRSNRANENWRCEIWDTRTQTPKMVLPFEQPPVLVAKFDCTGKRLLVAVRDEILVLDAGNGQRLMRIPTPNVNWIKCLDDQLIITGAPSQKESWKVGDQSVERLISIDTEGRRFINETMCHLSIKQNAFFLCGRDGFLRKYDLNSGEVVFERKIIDMQPDSRGQLAWSVEFDAEAKLLIVHPAGSKECLLVDVKTGDTLFSLQHESIPRSHAFTPDGRFVITGTGNSDSVPIGNAFIWDTKTGKKVTPPMETNAYVDDIEVSDDGTMLVTTTTHRNETFIQIWDVQTGLPLNSRIAMPGRIPLWQRRGFHPNLDSFLAWTPQGGVRLVDLPPFRERQPDWFPDLLNVVAGVKLNEFGTKESITPAEKIDLRKRIESDDSDGPFSRWGKWVLSPQRTRSFSPSSELGYVKVRSEWLAGDLEDARRTLISAPLSDVAHARAAWLLKNSDRSKEPSRRNIEINAAIWHIQRAREINPQNADIQCIAAEVYYAAKEQANAQAAVQTALAIDPENPNALYLSAVSLAEKEKWEQATSEFSQAIRSFDSKDDSHDTADHPPMHGLLSLLRPTQSNARRRDVRMPQIIENTFEDFESVQEGSLPDGWKTNQGNSASTLSRGRRTLPNWHTIGLSNISSNFIVHQLNNRTLQFVNGEPRNRLMEGNFIRVTSMGSELTTTDFDCSAHGDVYLAFHSVMSDRGRPPLNVAIEYSIDQGKTWLPAQYRPSQDRIRRHQSGRLDVQATLHAMNQSPTNRTNRRRMTPEMRERMLHNAPERVRNRMRNTPLSGRQELRSPFDLVRADISSVNEKQFESNPWSHVESTNRVEAIRLTQADRKPNVRIRFAKRGFGPWAIDNFCLFTNPENPIVTGDRLERVVSSPATNVHQLLDVVRRELDADPLTQRHKINANLLASAAAQLAPHNPEVFAIQARAAVEIGDFSSALKSIEEKISKRANHLPHWTTLSQIYESMGENFMSTNQLEHASVCFEIASGLLHAIGTDDRSSRRRHVSQLASLGALHDPEVLVPKKSRWKFLDDGSDQRTAWRENDFDDSSWKSGIGRFGYGDDIPTFKVSYGRDRNNKHITTYFRTEFENTGIAKELIVNLQRDDGAVVYLNGRQIVSSNMPENVRFDTPAEESVNRGEETRFFEYKIPAMSMRVGRNVLAVEVHQKSGTSSDLGFDLELSAMSMNLGSLVSIERLEETEAELKLGNDLKRFVRQARARLFAEVGDDDLAMHYMAQALAIDSGHPSLLFDKARIEYRMGDTSSAYQSFSRGLHELAVWSESQRTSPISLLNDGLKVFGKPSSLEPENFANMVVEMDVENNSLEPFELEFLGKRLSELKVDSNLLNLASFSLLVASEQYEKALRLVNESLSTMKSESANFGKQASQLQQFHRLHEHCLRLTGNIDEANAIHLKRLIPPRPQELSRKLIDLSAHYNAPLTDGATWASQSDRNLNSLIKTFVPRHGVEFDLRGICHLDGRVRGSSNSQFSGMYGREFPRKIKGIQVNLKTPALHFLMSSSLGYAAKDDVIAKLILHFEDGTQVERPIRFTTDVADWWHRPGRGGISDQTIGWQGYLENETQNEIALSELIWKNPHPNKLITQLDFISTNELAAPFLVGVTAE